MLIQCTQCQTVYNFDDSALQDSSIDVRCARCQTVFTVDTSSAVSEEACRIDESELQGMSFRSESDASTAMATEAAQPESAESLFEPEPEQTFEAPAAKDLHDDLHPEEAVEQQEPEDPFTFEPLSESPAAEPQDDFSFEPLDKPAAEETPQQEIAPEAATEDEAFSFASLDEPSAAEPAEEELASEQPAEEEDFAFSSEEQGDDVEAVADESPQQPVVDPFAEAADSAHLSAEEDTPQWDGSPEDFTFEDSGEDFSFDSEDSWSASESTTDQEEQLTEATALAPDTQESPDFIFEPLGEEAKAQTPQPAPVVDESPFAPSEEPVPSVTEQPEPEKPREAVRPAEKAPRPEKRGTSKFLLFILFLLLLVAGAYGYFYATLGTTDVRVMVREIQELVMPTGPKEPQGSLTIITSESYYIDNTAAGPLFVIQGTIRNDYKEPRAELSVTATLYKDKGQPFTKKTVYCGNEISRSDLESKPYEVLSESMSNPFGTALANVGVASGSSLPFIVVFNDLSEDLSQFSIEPANSKAASE